MEGQGACKGVWEHEPWGLKSCVVPCSLTFNSVLLPDSHCLSASCSSSACSHPTYMYTQLHTMHLIISHTALT